MNFSLLLHMLSILFAPPWLAAAPVQVPGTGSIVVGRSTAHTNEFLGIPFAHAERWGVPVDVSMETLTDRFDATSFGPCCPQVAAVYAPNQQEDCLNLNVFTPSPRPVRLAPVLLWIHGGGGTTGCSAQSLPPLYNGSNLISRSSSSVVVITINYRLSVLSNLYIEGGVPDNLQVRDQVSALRWVQRHVTIFGGDPSRVLLFGQSYGANAAQQLALIADAHGLFHHIVSESGTFTLASGLRTGSQTQLARLKPTRRVLEPTAAGFVNTTAANKQGRNLAEGLNCSQQNGADVVECLQAYSAVAIQSSVGETQLGTVVGAEMLPIYPSRMLKYESKINPSLLSVTAGWNEPDNFDVCASSGGRQSGPEQAITYLTKWVPLWTGADATATAAVIAAYNLSNCVPEGHGGSGSGPICCELVDLALRDAAMTCPAHRGLSAYSRISPHRPFWYQLVCCPTCPIPTGPNQHCVCQHTSELAYIFGTVSDYQSSSAPLTCVAEPSFAPFSDRLIGAWVGIATNNSHSAGGVEWPSFGSGSALFYLTEGTPQESATAWDAEAHHCDLWQSIDELVATDRFGAEEHGYGLVEDIGVVALWIAVSAIGVAATVILGCCLRGSKGWRRGGGRGEGRGVELKADMSGSALAPDVSDRSSARDALRSAGPRSDAASSEKAPTPH